MHFVYILYSIAGGKTYVGYTNDVNRRLLEHNVTGTTGFTLRYRPWTLIRTEAYDTKAEAIKREKFLKEGKGRKTLKTYVLSFLNTDNGAVSAAAEKD